MALHADYLQALVDRNNVYSPSKPDLGPKPPTLAVFPRTRRRSWFADFTAVRLLAVSGVLSWSIVALETWMLVR